jgi:nucleoporin POM152
LDSPTRPSFCLYDAFKRQSGSQAVVQLRGEPPFSLDIDILQPGSRRPIRHTIDGIKSHKWKVAVPDHVFSVHGLHTLSISGVRDSSECAAEVSEDDVTTMGIDVVEPASIVAVDRRTDHCVGDMLEFVLQGEWIVNFGSLHVPPCSFLAMFHQALHHGP